MENNQCFSVTEVISATGLHFTEQQLAVLNESENNEMQIGDVEDAFSQSQMSLEDIAESSIDDMLLDPEDFSIDNENSNLLHEVTNGPEGSAFHGNLEEGRLRNRRAKPEKWKKNVNKIQRMKGLEYEGVKKHQGSKETFAIRPARSIGVTCNSEQCRRRSSRYCTDFTEEIRNQLFEKFWNNLDWSAKKVYVNSLVDKIPSKRKYVVGDSSRVFTYRYTLKLEGTKKQVCRNMFLSTLGIGDRQLKVWLKKSAMTSDQNEPLSGPDVTLNEESPSLIQDKDFLQTFLESLPKMPSHYCRKDTMKLYLEPLIQTKVELYKLYKEACSTKGIQRMARCTLERKFDQMNLSLFRPKKDQCDICVSYTCGNINKECFDAHQSKKEMARASKANDKKDAKLGKCHVLTMDLESVKLSPHLKASALYYKCKLIVHNFTVYDLATHECKCYWWEETEGELVASTFATCVIDFLSRYNDNIPVIIYSDGCTAQNRNAIMSNALLRHAKTTTKMIYQKYLEKGHTQMECDSVHSAIETKLKNKEIFLPSEYAQVCMTARSTPFPYESHYLDHSFFKNYSITETQSYPSIRPGNKAGDLVVTDLRCLKYNPSGNIEYKTEYGDDWKTLPHRPRHVSGEDVPSLYTERMSITEKKWKDLQDLKPVIPAEFHCFYDTIPFKH